MPESKDFHTTNNQGIYNLAHAAILWIAILLLIKGNIDLQSQLNALPAPSLGNEIFKPSAGVLVTGSAPSSDLLGDQVVLGNLTVQGCILWQQPNGIFQNSCTLFEFFNRDCVNGVLTLGGLCLCEPHWFGPLCTRHDCYERGVFQVDTSSCDCNILYLDSSMCATPIPVNIPCSFDRKKCQGICINQQCICTLPGQIGLLCSQCAFPIISTTLCPMRKSWALEFVNVEEQFAVCGGGYIDSSSDALIIRALLCQTPDCSDFHNAKTVCCNPIAYNVYANILCGTWLSWQYNEQDYPSTKTVFNSVYRTRYLQIFNNYAPTQSVCQTDMSGCLLRAYQQIQAGPWPLLTISPQKTKPNYIVLGDLFLTLAISDYSTHVAPVMWTKFKQAIYFTSTEQYFQNTELRYIFLYQGGNAFCLGPNSSSLFMARLLFGAAISPLEAGNLMAWINLEDQPGMALPAASYCGLFLVQDNKVLQSSTTSLSVVPFFGPSVNFIGYFWSYDKGVLVQ